MTNEHVLVVGGGRDLPRRLREHRAGCRTSVMCQMYVLPKLLDVDGHARVLTFDDGRPDEEWVALAEEVHRHDPYTRVVSFGERDQLRAALIAARLGLLMHEPATVRRVHDKARMRQALHDAKVESVRSFVAERAEDVEAWVRDHPGSWIVKPLDGTASAGVSRVATPGEAAAAYARCQDADHPGRSERARVLVEEYLTGRQVSVESLSEHGEHLVVAVTEKFSDPRTFVELGHVVPARLSPEETAAASAHVVDVLTALGVREGACHTELVITDDGPRTIETHLRLGGDEIPDLVRDATGVDLETCLVHQTFGEDVLASVREQLREPGRASAIWYGTSTAAGVLERVDGVEEAKELEGVVNVELEIEPGADVQELTDSTSRVLWVRTEAAEAEQAVTIAREAVASLSVVVAQPAGVAGTDLV